MKRRIVSKKILATLAALALMLGAAAVTVFAGPSAQEGRVVDTQQWDNGFSVTYAYDAAE